MAHGKEVQDGLREPYRALRQALPEVFAGYAEMHTAAFRDGVLDRKAKELIALAVSITTQCDGCIAAHAKGAARAGATAEEVAEAIGVAVVMNGGPGTVYGPRAYAAFREFAGLDGSGEPPPSPA